MNKLYYNNSKTKIESNSYHKYFEKVKEGASGEFPLNLMRTLKEDGHNPTESYGLIGPTQQ